MESKTVPKVPLSCIITYSQIPGIGVWPSFCRKECCPVSRGRASSSFPLTYTGDLKVLLWYKDYLELGANKNQQLQKDAFLEVSLSD